MLTNGSATAARPGPRPPRREFVTTICTEELGRYAGVGLTLDQVIEEELRTIDDTPAAAPVEECDELVIWEKNKVVALIRVGPDRRPVVTRFDQPEARAVAPGTSVDDPGRAGSGPSPDALAMRETRAAIAHFHATRRGAEEAQLRSRGAFGAVALGPQGDAELARWETWAILAREAAVSSGRHLCRSILFLNGHLQGLADPGDAGSRRPDCGVILDDRLYLALRGEAGAEPLVIELWNAVRLDSSRRDASPGTV